MRKLRFGGVAGLCGLLLTLAINVFARRSTSEDDFPDYNRLEYAKPLPEADKQVPESQPGSINMQIGNKKKDSGNIPLDELPVSLHQNQKADTSEPPLDFIDAMPAVTASTTSLKNAPNQ